MKKCQLTDKKTVTGNSVSHSQIKTRRTFRANLHKRRLTCPTTGKTMTVSLSANGLRTLTKWDREGKKYALKDLLQK